MAHRPLSDLNQDLQYAGSKVKVGGLYAHYKHPDEPYLVTGLVILEATDEVAVMYEVEESGQQVAFIRPLKSWLETVEVDGQTIPRFTAVER